MLCVCFRDEKKRSWFHCLYTNLSPWEVSCLLCSISDCPLNKKLKGLDQGHILKNVIIRFSNLSLEILWKTMHQFLWNVSQILNILKRNMGVDHLSAVFEVLGLIPTRAQNNF